MGHDYIKEEITKGIVTYLDDEIIIIDNLDKDVCFLVGKVDSSNIHYHYDTNKENDSENNEKSKRLAIGDKVSVFSEVCYPYLGTWHIYSLDSKENTDSVVDINCFKKADEELAYLKSFENNFLVNGKRLKGIAYADDNHNCWIFKYSDYDKTIPYEDHTFYHHYYTDCLQDGKEYSLLVGHFMTGYSFEYCCIFSPIYDKNKESDFVKQKK